MYVVLDTSPMQLEHLNMYITKATILLQISMCKYCYMYMQSLVMSYY